MLWRALGYLGLGLTAFILLAMILVIASPASLKEVWPNNPEKWTRWNGFKLYFLAACTTFVVSIICGGIGMPSQVDKNSSMSATEKDNAKIAMAAKSASETFPAKPEPPKASTENQFPLVDPNLILVQYQLNPLGGEAQYKGKTVRMKLQVQTISKNALGQPMLLLSPIVNPSALIFNANFPIMRDRNDQDSKLAKLMPLDNIEIEGEIGSVMDGSIFLSDAKLLH